MISTSVISGMSSHPLYGSSSTVISPALPLLPRSEPTEKKEGLVAFENAITQLKQGIGKFGIDIDIHDDSGRIVTRVIDRESGDVIRQIPTEEVLHMARMAAYQQQGRLFMATA